MGLKFVLFLNVRFFKNGNSLLYTSFCCQAVGLSKVVCTRGLEVCISKPPAYLIKISSYRFFYIKIVGYKISET